MNKKKTLVVLLKDNIVYNSDAKTVSKISAKAIAKANGAPDTKELFKLYEGHILYLTDDLQIRSTDKKEGERVKIDVSILYEAVAYLLTKEHNRMIAFHTKQKDIKIRGIMSQDIEYSGKLLDKLGIKEPEESLIKH